eukprot:scaffold20663_cov184-Skeletonema_dohrnii-CCMP3373.AAC.1
MSQYQDAHLKKHTAPYTSKSKMASSIFSTDLEKHPPLLQFIRQSNITQRLACTSIRQTAAFSTSTSSSCDVSSKGRSNNLSSTQRSQIASQLAHLESLCPLAEPARNPLMEGPWIVLYTDAPPPSNGQLGPFKGVAKQVIDLQKGTYKNELYVGGSGSDEDENAWLRAVLEAKNGM